MLAMRTVSGAISHSTLVIVDAYAGRSWSWTDVFFTTDAFRAHMKTDVTRARATEIIEATKIIAISDGKTLARLIVCELLRERAE